MRARPFGTYSKQFLAALLQQVADLVLGIVNPESLRGWAHRLATGRVRPTGGLQAYVPKVLRSLGKSVPLDQNILAAEFIVRIASFRRVTVRLDAVMKIKNL